jgi:hypothetical protein
VKTMRTMVLILGCGLLTLSGVSGSIMAGLVGSPGERAIALLSAAVAGMGLINAAGLAQSRT